MDRGIVFQDFAQLFPWRTALGNVAFGLEMKGVPKKEREEIALKQLALVKLEKFARSYPHHLSGGMQQRVAIARALAYNPSVLLMDEPFAALDALTRDDMQRLLADVWRETRKTVIYVTHNVAEAVYLADRVVVMTPHPGTVKAEVPIRSPRPRDPLSIEFLEYQKQLLRHLGGTRHGRNECRISAAKSAEIVIVSSTAVRELMLALIPLFEGASGRKVTISFQFPPAVVSAIKAGAEADLVISPAPVIDELVQAGKLARRIDVFHSAVGIAVRAGVPRPDIGSAEALRRTLLAARSLACSTGPSGTMFASVIERLGLTEALRSKTIRVDGVPVGAVVASGEAEIGVQQIAEFLPIVRHRYRRTATARAAGDDRLFVRRAE